ncbi:ferrous iron transporter B [Arthrobacter sp. TPD3018]|uniref:Ferrous iron transport protein B n=1 Tax=Sphingomonas melonis TY TaxID=621456 RepID=A0A175Y4D5_9SPHN|nr:ferrous iron transporter B [Sphingomonas melonis TY]ATI57423.1 ferrous iron transporter B [Sphingomonas melonis]MBI0530669.1 ferrous iron transporter B [Sphingomonas sp. TX0522]MCP4026484.1 ferrous iron transporter B [Sphingomonas sp.]PVE58985.1 ferrous iron transporter B [Sphingomonas sp. TPD3009]PVE60507.1 ferrous iron transporter B [Arthrobacter sp. TPD3018]
MALVGNPNAGKSALFNALTGARQKVGNYPGVTVERHSGRLVLDDGRPVELIDLPGAYSLEPSSPDERVTRDVVTGASSLERLPDALVVVVDAANLDNHLRFTLQLIALGLPVVVALNMVDLAERDGLTLDAAVLERELGVPVIATVAVRKRGLDGLRAALGSILVGGAATRLRPSDGSIDDDIVTLQRRARQIAAAATVSETAGRRWAHALDAVALHPVAGPLLLVTILFVMFQAVFTWATVPADAIDAGFGALQDAIKSAMPDGFVRSLLTDGLIAGVGAVIVFLPQILILFLFILVLESSGYMVRAAFLMDRLMATVGLSGRAFIPLLSSFACAVPGIMATRVIDDEKDRLTTILIAPLMTCSARWPVYTLIIGAMIPNTPLLPFVRLQGVVMFGLLITGIAGAYVAALILRRTVTKGASSGFMMEMPKYQMPRMRDVALGLWQRAVIFLKRAGTIIAATTVVLWLLLSFPKPPEGSGISPVDYSVAGRIGHGIEYVVKPIGFNRDIALALLPAMAAREVAVSAIGTVYAIDDKDGSGTDRITDQIRGRWTLPTALAFLMWFVFAPQCISTIAVTRRETNGWKWPLFMVGYLFAAAYVMAGITFWLATFAGL